MAAGIYKKGQGYWTRTMSAIGAGLLILMGATWLWKTLETVKFGNIRTEYTAPAGATIFIIVFGLIAFWLIGRKQRVVDFMIATEGEMKKVHWSTRKEIMGMTWVVIALTMLVSAIIFVLDYLLFSPFFQWVGVLQKQAS